MRRYLQAYIDTILKDTWDGFRYVKDSGPLIACVSIIAIPLGYSADVAVALKPFDTAPLRAAATLLCAGLLFTKVVKPSAEKYYVAYWFFCLCGMLFLWTAMLLFNAASLPIPGSQPDPVFWILQYMVALFLFSQLCTTPQLGITVWVAATCSVYGCIYLFFEAPNWSSVHMFMTYPSPIYITAIALGSIYSSNKSIARVESLNAVRSIGSNLAHEIRTPISGIGSRAAGVSALMDDLVEGYRYAVEHNLVTEVVSDRQLDLVNESFQEIGLGANRASTMIDMVLVTTAESPTVGSYSESFTAKELVEEAVRTYPFKDDRERLMVSELFTNDFEIRGNKVALLHVLYNLIKNALSQVNKTADGSISLRTEKHTITVVDNGPGVPNEHTESIFEPFFTLTPETSGSGAGLPFSRSCMENLGGAVTYKRIGELTSFELSFPKL